MGRTVWRMLGMLLIVALVVAVFPRQTLACGCVIPPSPQEAFERADRVFAGIVAPPLNDSITHFLIGPMWKGEGPGPTEIPVVEVHASGPCGFTFRHMERYIVYAEEFDAENGRLVATVCSGTGALGDIVATSRREIERQRMLKRVAEGGSFAVLVVIVGWDTLQWYRDRRSKQTTPPELPSP